MFGNSVLDDWLDAKSAEFITGMGSGKPLLPEDMMVLVLKAQTNHFSHLDVELRKDMKDLREDMDKRFEQVDKRFEQMDKRFEQVDKRFDAMISRMDRLMIWSFTTTLSAAGIVIAAGKYW